jgi:hypothetical protein
MSRWTVHSVAAGPEHGRLVLALSDAESGLEVTVVGMPRHWKTGPGRFLIEFIPDSQDSSGEARAQAVCLLATAAVRDVAGPHADDDGLLRVLNHGRMLEMIGPVRWAAAREALGLDVVGIAGRFSITASE